MKTNYLKKYIISSYTLVWALIIFVAGTASVLVLAVALYRIAAWMNKKGR